MFIASNGLQILVDFLEFDFQENKDLIMIAIDSFLVLFTD